MLNWAGSLTISSYLVIGKGCTAKTKFKLSFGTQIALFPGKVQFECSQKQATQIAMFPGNVSF